MPQTPKYTVIIDSHPEMYCYYRIRKTIELDEQEASPLALFIPALKDEAFRALG